ncbi:unnamed protein product, partial [Prorocentrum cordatum]
MAGAADVAQSRRRRRPIQSAAEGRGQYARGKSRVATRLLRAFAEVQCPRGKNLSGLALALHTEDVSPSAPEAPGDAEDALLRGAASAAAEAERVVRRTGAIATAVEHARTVVASATCTRASRLVAIFLVIFLRAHLTEATPRGAAAAGARSASPPLARPGGGRQERARPPRALRVASGLGHRAAVAAVPALGAPARAELLRTGSMGAYLSEPVTEKECGCGSGNGLHFGYASMQGWRRSQEDAHLAVADLGGECAGLSLFAVFDGHGGREVPPSGEEQVPQLFQRPRTDGESVACGRVT